MGLSWSNLSSRLLGKKKMRILIVGLDGAGKTTILYKFKLGEILTTPYTSIYQYKGEKVTELEYKNMSYTLCDVGGLEKIKSLRKNLQKAHGLIFVVDSNDRERISEAQEELHKMLQDDELRDVVLLVFANKQDLPNAMNVTELIDKLGLIYCNRRWYIQATIATQGHGLYEGLDWLSNQLTKK